MTIGKRIKERREELRLSQRDLAEKMNYTNHSTIGKIERGQVDVSQTRIVQFAEVLGTSVSYLMGWEEETKKVATDNSSDMSEMSEAKKQLLALAKSCNEEDAEKLLQVMKLILNKQ